MRDIIDLLTWFVVHSQEIDLSAYDKKPKEEMMISIIKLYGRFEVVRDPLERTLSIMGLDLMLTLLARFGTNGGPDEEGSFDQEKDYNVDEDYELNEEFDGNEDSDVDGEYELDEEYDVELQSHQDKCSE